MGTPPESGSSGDWQSGQGWQSNWERPAEGEWKQAEDGSWYKEGAARPQAAAAQPGAYTPPVADAPPIGYSQPGTFVPAPGATSGKAIASLILGIGGFVLCPLICSILALVLGYQAKAEINASGGRLSGRGSATAGIVLGWIGIVLVLAFIALVIVGMSLGEQYDDF